MIVKAGTGIKMHQPYLYVVLLILLAPVLFYVFSVIFAGSDHAFALFMDERITFEPINKALSGTWQDKLAFFFDGHDNRYGRLLWNLNFITSYVPFKLFGEQGQVIATRITQTLVLMGGYYLMAWSLLKSDVLRILCFLCLLMLPQSFYYFLMPKPEPLIVLILGCMLYCLMFNKTRFYFLLIGILAGLKISTIPVCGILVLVYFIYFPGKISIRDFLQDLRKIFSWKILSLYLVLSVGMAFLVESYIRQTYFEQIYSVLIKKQVPGMTIYHLFIAFNALLATFFIMLTWLYFSKAYGKLSFVSAKLLQLLVGLALCNTYLYFTPFNILLYVTTPISHGADNVSITVIHWLDYIYAEIFFRQPVLLGSFLLALVVMITYSIYQWRKGTGINIRSITWLVLILCLVNLVPIIFFTKRLWGFYLLVPMVFLWLDYSLRLDRIPNKYVRVMGCIFLVLYPVMAFPGFRESVQSKKAIEGQGDFMAKKAEYLEVCKAINQMASALPNVERKAFWDPNLFFPDLVRNMDVKVFWGPFNHWQDGRKFVVLSEYPDKKYQLDTGNKNYQKINESISQFRNFTDSITGMYTEYKKDSFRYHRIFIKH